MDQSWEDSMAQLKGLSKEEWAWQPAEGQWSLDQVFDHLYQAESGSLAYLRKKTSGADPLPKAGVGSELRFQALKRALVSRKKWKAPRVVANIPPVEDHDALLANYVNTRKECREFVESLSLERRQQEVFKHPIAGRLNVYRMLDFFLFHFKHHGYQIERILAEMKKQNNG